MRRLLARPKEALPLGRALSESTDGNDCNGTCSENGTSHQGAVGEKNTAAITQPRLAKCTLSPIKLAKSRCDKPLPNLTDCGQPHSNIMSWHKQAEGVLPPRSITPVSNLSDQTTDKRMICELPLKRPRATSKWWLPCLAPKTLLACQSVTSH
jgi:hypothetical protein